MNKGFRYKGYSVEIYGPDLDDFYTFSVTDPEGTIGGEGPRFETKSQCERAAVEYIDEWINDDIYKDLM